ncbi:hypothetical protein M1N70_02615 [Peptococcaceae bacterium]|nr:hypothetical protein [Peptococcaceae bacterium]
MYEKGYDVDIDVFSQEFGVPIVTTVAVKGEGLEKLKEIIYKAINDPKKPPVNLEKNKDAR